MTGAAQLFIKYESEAKIFIEFATELQSKYGQKYNIALTHDKLRKQRRRRDEKEISIP